MQRQILLSLFITLSTAALLAPACTAHLEEGCLGGQCSPNVSTSGSGAGGTSGAGGGDGGVEGGPNLCVGMDPPATGDYPCPVFDVINRRCRPCHQNPPQQGAPFTLMSFEDIQKPYPDMPTRKIYQQMTVQTRAGAIPRMPQGADFTDQALLADLKVLQDWLDMCAPPVADGTGCSCPGMGCSPP